MKRFDVAIIGAGVLGLAHAYTAAKRGLKVAVFERSPMAEGASVRNFGMIWTVGQWGTPLAEVAQNSNRLWRELLADSEIWHDPCGSLTLTYHDDELQVAKEFVAMADDPTVRLVQPAEVASLAPSVLQQRLLGGIFSEREVHVDPRDAIAKLPTYLAQKFGVEFFWSSCVTQVESGSIVAGGQNWQADQIVVCSGHDYETLFPEHFSNSNLGRCKLQMLRAIPKGNWRIGPMLCAGLTLLHYKNFASCPSLDLVRQRYEETHPQHMAWGVHLLVSQHETGELVIGDSHEYGPAISPFNLDSVDQLILNYLNTFLPVTDIDVTLRWHGVYSTFDEQVYEAEVLPSVHIVTGVGGAGMTMSMGLGERTLAKIAR
ncbi:MAG: TIGR03364 family FAD-dependent oxidoreductase [Armatimonadota bacterium]